MTNLTRYNEMVLKYGKDVINEVREAVKKADGNIRHVYITYERQGMEDHANCLDEYYFGK